MTMNLGKVYICHWKKLKDRKNELIEILKEENILQYEFNEKYDKDDWDIGELKKIHPYAFRKTPSGRYLNESEISLLLKHYDIIRELSSNNAEYLLVLEDDVILCDDFLDNLEKCFNELPKDWDLVWVGTCCDLHEPKIENKLVYKTKRGSRCTHAYLISKTCANKILNNISKITEAIDHSFNFFIKELDLNNYWIEPPLAIQNPYYTTTIQIDK
jgi:GR25 family glycosyltransferase involved in LPS biosynthesis